MILWVYKKEYLSICVLDQFSIPPIRSIMQSIFLTMTQQSRINLPSPLFRATSAFLWTTHCPLSDDLDVIFPPQSKLTANCMSGKLSHLSCAFCSLFTLLRSSSLPSILDEGLPMMHLSLFVISPLYMSQIVHCTKFEKFIKICWCR